MAKWRSTGLTILGFFMLALVMSVLPLPESLKPAGDLRIQENRDKLTASIFGRANSAALPWRGLYAGAKVKIEEPLIEMPERAPPIAPIAPATPGMLSRPPLKLPHMERYRKLAQAIGAKFEDLENNCVEMKAGKCAERALDHFYASLDSLYSLAATSTVRVVHYGDSLIASDRVTDIIRARLSGWFGSGGRGFLFPDRPNPFAGRRARTGRADGKWKIQTIVDENPPDGKFGFSGVRFVSTAAGASIAWETMDYRAAEIYYLVRPGGKSFKVLADGRQLAVVETASQVYEARYSSLTLPPGTRKLRLVAAGGGVAILGVSIEALGSGIVYDSIGLPGAHAAVFNRMEEDDFARLLEHRDPAMVVYMIGGGDAFLVAGKKLDAEKFRTRQREALMRIRRAVPQASCLVGTTIDIAKVKMGGQIKSRPEMGRIVAVQREEAKRAGCAFFNMYQAMGGEGSVKRWNKRGLIGADMLHPTRRGLNLLGQLFTSALMQKYRAKDSAGKKIEFEHNVGFLENAAPGILDRFFARLDKLERGEIKRVAAGQFGASHTAAHMFTDRLRSVIGKRFGIAGRGYIAAGRDSPRLSASGVHRSLTGNYRVIDGLYAATGTAVGLSGVRVDLEPKASFSLRMDKSDKKHAARVEVMFLAATGTGQAYLKIDGRQYGMLSAPPGIEPGQLSAQLVRLELKPSSREISIEALGPGITPIFGVAWESSRPGLIYDAAGLPTSTGLTPLRWQEQVFGALVAMRAYDLVVTWWGTNEAKIPDLDPRYYENGFKSTLAMLTGPGKKADCIIVGSTDRFDKNEEDEWVAAPSLSRVTMIQRKVAADFGCAFWAAQDAMGGPGSIKKWLRKTPRLAHPDHIHLSRKGYERLADMFAADLLKSYRRWQKSKQSAGERQTSN